MRTLRRRPIATAAVAAAAAFSLGACSDTNFSAQTNQQYQASIGADHRGDVDVLGALVVENTDGVGTLSAGLVNHNDEAVSLTGITAATLNGNDPLTVTAPEEETEIGSKELVQLGRSNGPIFGITDAPVGEYVRLTLTFSDSTEVDIEAPVVARNASYTNIAPAS